MSEYGGDRFVISEVRQDRRYVISGVRRHRRPAGRVECQCGWTAVYELPVAFDRIAIEALERQWQHHHETTCPLTRDDLPPLAERSGT